MAVMRLVQSAMPDTETPATLKHVPNQLIEEMVLERVGALAELCTQMKEKDVSKTSQHTQEESPARETAAAAREDRATARSRARQSILLTAAQVRRAEAEKPQ